jgi:[ribosomal protein S18]-alanine N-acetyltransferase
VSAQLQDPREHWRLQLMTPQHLAQVMDIELRAYDFPWTEGIFRDCLKVGYSSWVVTNTLGEVLAYALMSMAVGEGHILNLCVDPALRRQGLARFLLDHLLELARTSHLTMVLLEVRRSNKVALALYRGYGFERVGVRKGYYPAQDGREDAFVLCLDIV